MATSILEKARKAVRDPGLAVRWLRRQAEGFLNETADWAFDHFHNVDTGKRVKHSDLDAVDTDSLKHATAYQAMQVRYLDFIFRKLGKRSTEEYFIDIGCGKGRACFYASRKYPRVIGIDFSPSLIREAEENLKSFRGGRGNISFMVRDARIFDLPESESIVYLFNPFDEVILGAFLDRNREHFSRYRSRIVYVNDLHRSVLLDRGFRQETRHDPLKLSFYTMPELREPSNYAKKSIY